MEHVYCIDLNRLSKIELSEIISRFNLEIDIEELSRLKNSGYNTVFLDRPSSRILFYTLNNSKRDIKIGDHIKNQLQELKPLGFGTRTVTPPIHQKCPPRRRELTKDQIITRFNEILEKIHCSGLDSISEEEHSFLTKYKNQVE